MFECDFHAHIQYKCIFSLPWSSNKSVLFITVILTSVCSWKLLVYILQNLKLQGTITPSCP